MKKKILFLCEYPFTQHSSFKMEVDYLKKKKIDFTVIDLSQIVYGKNFSKEWKTKIEKNSIKFSSLISWLIFFLNLNSKKIIIWNNIKAFNLNSFIIELFLRFSNIKIILHYFHDVFSSAQKKTFFFVLDRIKYHKLNIWPYLFFFQKKVLRFILNLFPYKDVSILSNDLCPEKKMDASFKKIKRINFNSYDFSNFIILKNKTINKKRYAIYTDSGGPYFSGDRFLNMTKKDVCDHENYYGRLNLFFKKLEKIFNIKVLIIPHPKYKSKNNTSLNPFFDKSKVINYNDALPKLTKNCTFFINHSSTSQSFAVASYKPVIMFYSSKYYKEAPGTKAARVILAKNLGINPIDICKFKTSEVKKLLKINKKKYNEYKYNYLTPKNKLVEKMPNYQIVKRLVSQI